MKILLFLTLVVLPAAVNNVQAAEYNIEELRSNTAGIKPFSITEVEQQSGELRLFIQTNNIAQIQRLITNGSLSAQYSDGDDALTVPLSLFKAVTCDDGTTHHLGYSAQMPNCEIRQTRYYMRTPVTLGPGCDLAIGLDPDFIWLVERR